MAVFCENEWDACVPHSFFNMYKGSSLCYEIDKELLWEGEKRKSFEKSKKGVDESKKAG